MSDQNDLSGMLLVATPALTDPSFHKTILFVAAHSAGDGAVAYILNRPTQAAINVPTEKGPLEVSLWSGGPVQQESVTLASLQWRAPAGIVAFHTFGGEDPAIPSAWIDGLRAFAGYAGWSPGQLENELRQQAWIVIRPTPELIATDLPDSAWAGVMKNAGPLMRLLAGAPEDPSRN